jgi:DNA-binding PadR family transcriptional regulator
MASSSPGSLSASIAVLGLLVERSDTVAGVRFRLDEEHPGACWQSNVVHNTVPRLVDEGLVRITVRGSSRALDQCEATSEGRERIDRWKREPSVAPPERDELRAKLKYVEDGDDLAATIRDIRRQEDECVARHKGAVTRYVEARAVRQLDARAGTMDRRVMVRRALMTDEIRRWQGRLKDLQRLRRDLEDPDGARDTLDTVAGDG